MPALAMGLTDHSETRKRSFWGVRWAQDRQRSHWVPSSSAGSPRGLLLRHESCPQTPRHRQRCFARGPVAASRQHRQGGTAGPSDASPASLFPAIPMTQSRVYGFRCSPPFSPTSPGAPLTPKRTGNGQEEPPHEQPPGPALPHLTEAMERGRLSPVTPPTAPGPLPWPAPRHGGSGRHCSSADRWRGCGSIFTFFPSSLLLWGNVERKCPLLPLIWNAGKGRAQTPLGLRHIFSILLWKELFLFLEGESPEDRLGQWRP